MTGLFTGLMWEMLALNVLRRSRYINISCYMLAQIASFSWVLGKPCYVIYLSSYLKILYLRDLSILRIMYLTSAWMDNSKVINLLLASRYKKELVLQILKKQFIL